MKESELLTVKQLSRKYPAFTESALRGIIFNKNKNGFDKAVRKIGPKVLISEAIFLNWLNSSSYFSETEKKETPQPLVIEKKKKETISYSNIFDWVLQALNFSKEEQLKALKYLSMELKFKIINEGETE